MKVALSLIGAVSVSASGTGKDSIAMLVEMMSGFETKVMKEGEEAQKVYAKFAEWCEDRSKELHFEVKTAKREIQNLEATVYKESNAQGVLTTKIEDTAGHIASEEKDLAAATKIRDEENADFQAKEKELVDVLDTLARAISVIEKEMAKGGAAMMQLKSAKSLTQVFKVMVQANSLNTADAQKLTAFVQNSNKDGDDELGAPAGSVYENQSGGIIDVLQSLRDESTTQLDEARQVERTAANKYEMLKQSLQDEIKFANKELSEAKRNIAASREAQGVAEGDLEITKKDLAQDTSVLADLHHECMAKSQDFETQTQSRVAEMKGIAIAKKAIEGIQLREQGRYDFRGASFLQTSSSTDEASRKVIHALRGVARQHKDSVLAQIASRMSFTADEKSKAGEDVFAALKQQFMDAIKKLQDEEEADATHKVFCDKNLAETEVKKADKKAEVEKHTAKIEQKTSESVRVKAEVATLEKELATMTEEKLEMDTIRQKEKSDYEFNKAEAEKSVKEIKLALNTLRDFYGTYAKQHDGFSSSDGGGQGVMAMLEAVESEYSTNIVKMTSEEEAAVMEYDKASKAFEFGKIEKDQAIKYKTKEHIGLDNYAAEETNDRSGTQTELDAVLDAYAQLKKQCTGQLMTYEVRVARREEELAELNDSLASLDALAGSISPPAAEASPEVAAEAAQEAAHEAAHEAAAEAAPEAAAEAAAEVADAAAPEAAPEATAEAAAEAAHDAAHEAATEAATEAAGEAAPQAAAEAAPGATNQVAAEAGAEAVAEAAPEAAAEVAPAAAAEAAAEAVPEAAPEVAAEAAAEAAEQPASFVQRSHRRFRGGVLSA
jgi:hypothetical protein